MHHPCKEVREASRQGTSCYVEFAVNDTWSSFIHYSWLVTAILLYHVDVTMVLKQLTMIDNLTAMPDFNLCLLSESEGKTANPR